MGQGTVYRRVCPYPKGPTLGLSDTVKGPALVVTRALDSSGTRAGTKAGTRAGTRARMRAGTSWGTWGR